MGKQKMTCSEVGCDRVVLARSLCKTHYEYRKYRGIEMPPKSNKPRGVPCCVEECKTPAMQRGYCEKHLNRLDKYGDPLAGPTFNGAGKAWVSEHLDYQGDDCLIWPFARSSDGHGNIYINKNKTESLAAYICELARGPKPTPEHQAAHRCGNGHLACGNRNHLRWATIKENAEDRDLHDRTAHGERSGTAKLTWPQVREIRRLHHILTQPELAERYSVSVHTIDAVQNWRTWRRDPLLTAAPSPSSTSLSCQP